MDQFNSRNDDDEHFRAVAHDLHDLHAQTNPQILAEKLHKFFVKHSGLHPDQARNVVEGMFQKAGHATHFADGGPVDKALNVVGQQQADPVAVAKQVASMPPARQLSPMGLYSHGAETAAALPQAKGSPQQMKAMLKGVKQEELGGYDDAFSNKKSVTRDEIAEHFRNQMPEVEEKVLGTKRTPMSDEEFRANLDDLYDKHLSETGRHPKSDAELKSWAETSGSPTKFGEYVLPGGENYREVLLKFPHEEKRRVGVLSNGTIMTEEELANPVVRRTAEKIGLTMEDRMMPTMQPFKSQHWDDPNVLAHLRLADRTGPNGEKILHVEEIQSDWGQKGKKEGFRGQPVKGYLVSWNGRPISSYDTAEDAAAHVQRALRNDPNAPVSMAEVMGTRSSGHPEEINKVPSAPYVTNTQAWTDLALKRALREAAEGGYDKLVWTPGAEQAKRYSLSNHVDEVQYSPGRNGTHSVEAYKGNNNVFNKPNATIKEIADTFGQEIADKIASGHGEVNRNTGYNVLSGLDLETGGEGMKGYYDKIVPKRLQELVKKHDPDAKVGYTDVMLPPKGGAGHNNPPFEAPGITITPKMRESILRGQPAFKRGGAIPLHPALNIPGVHIRTAEAGEPFFHGDK